MTCIYFLTNHDNGSLRTTLPCLHTPPTLACAAIFLTTRDLQIKLPSGWMQIFDVELDDVVHVAAHLKIFYHEEEKGIGIEVPVTLNELEALIPRLFEDKIEFPEIMECRKMLLGL